MTIESFQGKYRFLSNFWKVTIEHNEEEYPSTEHAYQAMKFTDPKVQRLIRETRSPGQAKRLGQRHSIRRDWEDVKVGIMTDLNRIKYQNPALRKLLLATGDQKLIEGNTWGDVFWGVCRGYGENMLGRILMEIRDEVREEEKFLS